MKKKKIISSLLFSLFFVLTIVLSPSNIASAFSLDKIEVNANLDKPIYGSKEAMNLALTITNPNCDNIGVNVNVDAHIVGETSVTTIFNQEVGTTTNIYGSKAYVAPLLPEGLTNKPYTLRLNVTAYAQGKGTFQSGIIDLNFNVARPAVEIWADKTIDDPNKVDVYWKSNYRAVACYCTYPGGSCGSGVGDKVYSTLNPIPITEVTTFKVSCTDGVKVASGVNPNPPLDYISTANSYTTYSYVSSYGSSNGVKSKVCTTAPANLSHFFTVNWTIKNPNSSSDTINGSQPIVIVAGQTCSNEYFQEAGMGDRDDKDYYVDSKSYSGFY